MIFRGVLILLLDLVFQTVFRASDIGLENRGVSFGMASEIGNIISFIALSLFIGWFLFELIKFRRFRPSLFLVALGGLGNIFYRFIWGSVWDYICLPFLPFCFNLSDVLISLGVVSYILGVDGNRGTLRRQRDAGNQ